MRAAVPEARIVDLIPAGFPWVPKRLRPARDAFGWIFFGADYVRLKKWEAALGTASRLPMSQRLHDKAWQLRMPYVAWLEQLGAQHRGDRAWWYSLLAEKDTTCDDFFLNLCCLSIVADLHDSGALPEAIVADSLPLLLALQRQLGQLGVEVRVAGGIRLARGAFLAREGARFVASWIYKLGIIARRTAAARLTRHLAPSFPADPAKPRALLFFWVGDADMGVNGDLRNAYFTRLPGLLASSGYDVLNIARPHKIRRSFRSAFAWLRARGDVLVPEDFTTWRDAVDGIGLLLGMIRVPAAAADFHGLDVRDLLAQQRLRQASNAMFIQFLAYGSMIARLKAQGFRIDAFLFPFENMALEKPITAALHEHYPDARIVGFQHTTVTPFMLKFSAWQDCFEAGARYFPDEIVCNGPGYRHGLAASGFPPERLTVGPALRYLYLWEERARDVATDAAAVVLVTLPLSFAVAVEMLGKALELVQDRSIPVGIKAHPFSDREKLLRTLGLARLPDGVQWCEGPMQQWLGRTICLLSLGSGTLVEAVSAGVPIVILGLEGGLEFNPLGWWEKDEPMFSAVYSMDEARRRVRYWMELPAGDRAARMKEVSAFMMRQFAPWNAESAERMVRAWLEPGRAPAQGSTQETHTEGICLS
jgi:hypothetical protein